MGAPQKEKKIRGPWARAQCAHWLRRPWAEAKTSKRSRTSNLFVELLGDAVGPLEVEVFGLARPVNVGHLDDHVDGHQTVSFRRPVDAHRVRVIRLSPATAMSQPEMTMGQRVTGQKVWPIVISGHSIPTITDLRNSRARSVNLSPIGNVVKHQLHYRQYSSKLMDLTFLHSAWTDRAPTVLLRKQSFFRTDTTDSPDCLPTLLSISVFTFKFFFFYFLVFGSARKIRLTYLSFWAHVKIASHIISYRFTIANQVVTLTLTFPPLPQPKIQYSI